MTVASSEIQEDFIQIAVLKINITHPSSLELRVKFSKRNTC